MEAFIGTILPWAPNFAPVGWMLCQGQTLAINSNQALFALIGTMYGGNGTTNFMLPNLQGAFPRGAEHRITAIGNGYFHVEIQIPHEAAAGMYQLSGVYANAATSPDYTGAPPQMTVSPVRERYCITVVPTPAVRSRRQ